MLDKVKDLKQQGKTVKQVAATLKIPIWLAVALYNIVKVEAQEGGEQSDSGEAEGATGNT